MYNLYANDGTEFIISFCRGTNRVTKFCGLEDKGEVVKTGDFDSCYKFVQEAVTNINADLIG